MKVSETMETMNWMLKKYSNDNSWLYYLICKIYHKKGITNNKKLFFFFSFLFEGIFVYMGYSVWHSHESDEDEDEDNSLGIHGLSLNVAIDEENDEIVHCLEDITDGSSV